VSSRTHAHPTGETAQCTCGVLLLDVTAAVRSGLLGRLGRRVAGARSERRDAALLLRRRAASLQKALPRGWGVFHAVHGFSDGALGIDAALIAAEAAGVRRLVVVMMRPQFSQGLSGRALHELYARLCGRNSGLHVEVRASYADDAAYVEAVAHSVMREALARSAAPASHELVFVGGTRFAGDQDSGYQQQLTHTAELVAARLGWDEDRWRVQTRADASASGGHVLTCSLGELPPPEAGAEGEFTKVLVGLVRRGVHSLDPQRARAEPLLKGSWRGLVERDVDELVMLGVCVHGAIADSSGQSVRHCTKEEYRTLKRPHMEVVELLSSLHERKVFGECFVWSTCNRFELYGWLPREAARREAIIGELRRELLGEPGKRFMNVLEGRAAWQHLLRTTAGLNSALGGDAEVVEQLDAAVRTAHHAGSAGPRCDALVANAQAAVHELRKGTNWGRFEHRYCWIALERLAPEFAGVLPDGDVVVLGGSTTSCSILEALGSRFGIARERISLFYRGERNGRLAKRMHAAAAQDRVLSVETYSDPEVASALARADLVLVATDQREPVLNGLRLGAGRDLAARPITIIDFNTFGSTEDLQGVEGVRLIDASAVDERVEGFNREIVDDVEFLAAAGEADRWIAERTGLIARETRGGKRSGGARKQVGATP
jgi:glutamyl-tRNA reductase